MPGSSSDTLLQDTKQVLTEFIRVFKLYWFYSENHPSTHELVNKLSILLTELVKEGPLRLNLSKDEIFLGAVPLDNKDKNVMEFARHLNRRRIYNVTIMPDVTEAETFIFVKVLAMDPKQIRRLGGTRKLLTDQQVTHFDVSEYFYDSASVIGDTEKKDSGNPALMSLNEEILLKFQAFLRGTIEELGGDEELFIEFLQNPLRLTELMNRIIAELGTNDTTKIVRFIQDSIHHLCLWINRGNLQDKSLLMQKVSLSLLHQPFDLGIETLINREGLNEDQQKSIREITDYLSDEELLELVLKKSFPNAPVGELRTFIASLPIAQNRCTRLTQTYSEMMEKKRKAEVDQLEMNKLQERFQGVTYSFILNDAVGFALELFETELQATVQKDILEMLSGTMKVLIMNKDYDVVLDVLRTLLNRKQQGTDISPETIGLIEANILSFSSNENIERLIGYFENVTGENEEKIIGILSLLGQEGTTRILTHFINTPKLILRRPLSRVLIQIGSLAADEIILQLPNSPDDVGREFITILGHIGTKETIEKLKRVYTELSPGLRQQVISIISETKSPESRDWLIQQINSNRDDSSLQISCLDALGKIGDAQAIEVLRKFALSPLSNSDSDRLLQHKAIQWLGKLNVTESVADLIQMFRKGRWFPSKKRDQLRIVVAQTLWKINDANAEQAVRNGCKDFRKTYDGYVKVWLLPIQGEL